VLFIIWRYQVRSSVWILAILPQVFHSFPHSA
jgi:hypothetical protein